MCLRDLRVFVLHTINENAIYLPLEFCLGMHDPPMGYNRSLVKNAGSFGMPFTLHATHTIIQKEH